MLLPTKKSKALLAYLALAGGQRRSRSLLASLLWDEAGEPQARESLRQTLSLLRKTLLPSHSQPIISEGDAIALDPSALYVDALEFAQFADATEPDAHAHAANLFSGELLEGFDLHAPEFDRWLSAVRQGYHEKAVDLLSRLLAHYIASGNLERAASVATRLLTLDPLRESSHRALMELYSKQGRYAAALRQYQVCLDVLVAGVECRAGAGDDGAVPGNPGATQCATRASFRDRAVEAGDGGFRRCRAPAPRVRWSGGRSRS